MEPQDRPDSHTNGGRSWNNNDYWDLRERKNVEQLLK